MKRAMMRGLLLLIAILARSVICDEDGGKNEAKIRSTEADSELFYSRDEFEYYQGNYDEMLPEDDSDEIIETWTLKLFRIIFSLIAASILWFVWDIGVTPQEVIYGVPFHKSLTKIAWPTESPELVVSNTKNVTVSFTTFNGVAIDKPLTRGNLTAEVFCDDRFVPLTSLIETENGGGLSIVFNASRAGYYKVILRCNRYCVRGFPTYQRIAAGDVDPLSTLFHELRSKTLVLTSGVPEDIKLDPRDKYGNPIDRHKLAELTSRISFQLWHLNSSEGGRRRQKVSKDNFVVYRTASMVLCISVAFTPSEEGWYVAQIQLDGEPISGGELSIIVLSRNEKAKVDRFMVNRRNKDFYPQDQDYFEADLVSQNGQKLDKPKKVYCYLTDKQLSIREYFLKIFLKRTFSYRLVPATKMSLVRYQASNPVIRIEDGYQRPGPEICFSRDGVVFVAAFHRILLEKVGGSETFQDKKCYFNAKLLAFHERKGHKHVPHYLKVSRYPSLLKNSIHVTKSLSDQDWARLFVIEFEGEPGIDQGGLRREWFDLVTSELFNPKNRLFIQVEEGSSVIHPNPHPPSDIKARQMFKFAGKIVGKCLYESAHGVGYSHYLPVRMAKSFLAQLVGLRVNFRHFADDAPEFFASKVRLIETSNVEDSSLGLDDLTFAEEVFDPEKKVAKIVDLKAQGCLVRVTESNKLEYLDLLAQHRLSSSIKDQLDSFLEGLHTFVPDSLLSMFDESELELLLCGVHEYKLSELKRHHIVVNDGLSSRTLEWFWLALSHFTSLQFAKLMQFSTGSSQLPPGGFAELRPRFQIASNHCANSLPTAHTCFNMICLPEHANFPDFEKALLTAITEGSEGFGMA